MFLVVNSYSPPRGGSNATQGIQRPCRRGSVVEQEWSGLGRKVYISK